MSRKILFILEGESDELKFFKRMLEVCNSKQEYEIYSYKTNIHVLAQELYNNYPDFDEGDIDIKLILKSLTNDQNEHQILSQKYKDIYMVFDYELQHDCTHFDTVRRMVDYFDDSTSQGKLFINYPMMQSFKHLSMLPDPKFCNKAISTREIKNYKAIVAEESSFTNLTKYNYETFFSLAVHHLKKANYILNGEYKLPDAEEYTKWQMVHIFDFQQNVVLQKGCVFILNTSIFILAEFTPEKFFAFVEKHKKELRI